MSANGTPTPRTDAMKGRWLNNMPSCNELCEIYAEMEKLEREADAMREMLKVAEDAIGKIADSFNGDSKTWEAQSAQRKLSAMRAEWGMPK